MTTYVLSNLNESWHVHRHDEDITVVATHIVIESEALELALSKAGEDRPSRVVRITQLGEYQIITTFDVESQ